MASGEEFVADSELLLRRIQEDQGPSDSESRPSPLAFRPNKRDVDGLSLYREAQVSAEELASWGRVGKKYFIGRVRTASLRELGMTVVPVRDPAGRPGHVIIPELNAANRREARQEEWQFRLASLCTVLGPFEGAS